MIFNKNSALVSAWVRLVREGTFKRDNVPKLANLQEVVWSILDEK